MIKGINVKTIAIFSGYSLPHLGGIEKYTNNLINELIKKEYKIINVSSNYQFTNKYKKKKDNVINLLLPVRKIFVGRYPIPKRNSIYREVIKCLNEQKIDAIIVNTRFHLTSLIGSRYGKKHGIPVYLIEHGSQHLTVNNKFLDYLGAKYEHILTKIVEKNVDYNYGVSKAACEWQKHFGIQSDGVWYNSINDFSKNVKLLKNKDGNINICYAGRILQQKGLKRLLESFMLLLKEYDNIILNIAGDGEYLDVLKRKYNNKNINYLGKLDFKELVNLYSYTDIFVYAPIWPEGLPTSILEAGLMKCAVVASPQGGIKEIIEDNVNGLMIENESELYNALMTLIANPKLRSELANRLKEKVSKEFVWSETVKTVIKNINEQR